jgi:undecaprenyl-diphosphatase
MIDMLAHFCLKFGHVTFIPAIVVILTALYKRDTYAKALCLLAWVMIFNTLLKQLFKIPLMPHLGNGYAFPSGHMHAAAVFYGYMLLGSRSRIAEALLTLILASLGWSLIYCHFHDMTDVLGAIAFATMEISVYQLLSTKFGNRVTAAISIITAILIMLCLNVIYRLESHVWIALCGLLCTEFALFIAKTERTKKIAEKLHIFPKR